MIEAGQENNQTFDQQRPSALLTRQKSSNLQRNASVRSCNSASSGSNLRYSASIFALDAAVDPIILQNKKLKLQQLILILQNKKQKIVDIQNQLNNQISIRDRQKIKINQYQQQLLSVPKINSQQSPQQISQISQISQIQQKKQKQFILINQSLQTLKTQQQKLRTQNKTQQQQLIKTKQQCESQINLTLQLIQNSVNQSQTNAHLCLSLKDQIGERQIKILELQNNIVDKQEELKINNEKEQQELLKQQNVIIKNMNEEMGQYKKKIEDLEKQKEQFRVLLEEIERQQRQNKQVQINGIKERSKGIVIPQRDSNKPIYSRRQQSQISEQIQYIIKLISHFDTQYIVSEQKVVEENISKIPNQKELFLEQNNKKQKLIEQNNKNLSKKISQLKSTNQKVMKQQQQLHTNKYSVQNNLKKKSQNNNNNPQSQNLKKYNNLLKQIQKLKKISKDLKTQAIKLQSIEKQSIPNTLFQQYKKENQNYIQQITFTKHNISQSQILSKQKQDLKEQLNTIEWRQNKIATDLQKKIKSIQLQKEQKQLQNKQMNKKMNQSSVKIKEYKHTYPDFVINVQKQKQKSIGKEKESKIKGQIIRKQQVKEGRQNKVVEGKKKKNKNKNRQNQQQIQNKSIQQSINQVEKTVSDNIKIQKVIKGQQTIEQIEKQQTNIIKQESKVKKNKKKNKQSILIKQQQPIPNPILQTPSITILSQPLTLTSTPTSTPQIKKDKKDKRKQFRKLKISSQSKQQDQLKQFQQLMKDNNTPNKTFQSYKLITSALLLLAGVGSYWIFS